LCVISYCLSAHLSGASDFMRAKYCHGFIRFKS